MRDERLGPEVSPSLSIPNQALTLLVAVRQAWQQLHHMSSIALELPAILPSPDQISSCNAGAALYLEQLAASLIALLRVQPHHELVVEVQGLSRNVSTAVRALNQLSKKLGDKEQLSREEEEGEGCGMTVPEEMLVASPTPESDEDEEDEEEELSDSETDMV